jgi:hypothetical protein
MKLFSIYASNAITMDSGGGAQRSPGDNISRADLAGRAVELHGVAEID